MVLVNIHTGGYATPSSGQPDYRTAFGAALASQSALTGYPAGTVNRHVFAGLSMTSGGTAMSRANWQNASGQILPLTSPVNVGLQSVFDSATRLLTVTVELYYTATSPQPTNYINVAFLENDVIGPQNILGTMNASYHHMHMHRHFLTGQWGDTLTSTAAGSHITRTYTWSVPAQYNIDKSDVAAYVSESNQEIYTGVQVAAKNASTMIIGGIVPPASLVDESTPSVPAAFIFDFESAFVLSEDFIFTLTGDAPSGWTGSFTLGGNTYTGSQTFTLAGGSISPVTLEITPGSAPGIGSYTLSIASSTYPDAPVKSITVRVMSGVTDLVVNNSSGWGDGGTTRAEDFEQSYLKGLIMAGNNAHTSTSSDIFTEFAEAGKLSQIGHIYFNMGWAFPSFTNKLVALLAAFLDNGGNLMVAGQDVGWDTWDTGNGGNGTATTQSFYTNYLHASFVNDGGAANNQFVADPADAVFGNLAGSTVTNVYGSGTNGAYFYPDQLNETGGGFPFFFYDSGKTKKGGIRSETPDYKTVYFGIGLEMITDTNVRKLAMKQTHDWFHGTIGTEDAGPASDVIMIAYPNPARGTVTLIYTPMNSGGHVEITDPAGRLLLNIPLQNGSEKTSVDVSSLQSGIYFCRLVTSDQNLSAIQRIVVAEPAR